VRSAAIARNYAETLLTLAQRHGGAPTVDAFGQALEELVALLREEPRVRKFLETPLVEVEAKKKAVRATLDGRVPELFLRFVLVVVDKRRAAFLPDIATQYRDMVDQIRGRVRATVTVAREPDESMRSEIRDALQRSLGREVIATYQVDEGLLGGAVLRVGDQILDGSVRRRASDLRRRLRAAVMPGRNGAEGSS
jgi:F-type H+-transporting ATPase subunit delta